MGIYLGDDGRKISRLSTEPVYAGGKRIVRVYAGSRLVYPDKAGYSYAHMYVFPARNDFGDGKLSYDCQGTGMKFNDGAQIDDAVIYRLDKSESGDTEDGTPNFIYSMAAKGRNITSARLRGFLGYRRNVVYESSDDNTLLDRELSKKDLGGGVSLWYMDYFIIEAWPFDYGNLGTTLVDSFTADLRILRSEDAYYDFIGEEY